MLMALSLIIAYAAMAQSALDPLPGIQSALPAPWTCRISGPSDSLIWPQGIFKPLFTASFVDTVHRITGCSSKSDHPNLLLCFYAFSLRDTIDTIIKTQSIFSWCIPIKYLESTAYCIVTSPCYINNGCFSAEAKRLIAPLDSALADYFNPLRTSTWRSSCTKTPLQKSRVGAGIQVLANGRIVAKEQSSAAGVRFGDRIRVLDIKNSK
jgi:hypothetical protein